MKKHYLVDLHFHTNDSFDAYENAGFEEYDLNKIIENAQNSNIGKVSLICKTDHNILNFDKYLIDKAIFKENGIEYFIGIEVRGNEKVHWIFIFDHEELEKIDSGLSVGKKFESKLYTTIFGYDLNNPIVPQAKVAQSSNIEIDKLINLLHEHKLSYLAIPHLNKTGGFYNAIKSNEEALKSLITYLNDSVINGFESRQQSKFIIDSIMETQKHIEDEIVKLENTSTNEEIKTLLEGIAKREKHLDMMTKLENAVTSNDVSIIYGSDFHGKGGNDKYKDEKFQLFFMHAELTFQGLKLSLLDQSSRIQSVEEYEKYSKDSNYVISHIDVEVNNRIETIQFGDSLNSFIGARGSGKSYLLKTLIGNTDEYKSSGISKDIKLKQMYLNNGIEINILNENMFDYLGQQGSKNSGESNFYNLLAAAPYDMTKFETQIKRLNFVATNIDEITSYFNYLNKMKDSYQNIYNEVDKEIDYKFVEEYNSHLMSFNDIQKTFDVFRNFNQVLGNRKVNIDEQQKQVKSTHNLATNLLNDLKKIKEISYLKTFGDDYLSNDLTNLDSTVNKLKKILVYYEKLTETQNRVQKHVNSILARLNKNIDNKTNVLNSKQQSIDSFVKNISRDFKQIRINEILIDKFVSPIKMETSYIYASGSKDYVVKVIREFDFNLIDENRFNQIFSKYNNFPYDGNVLNKFVENDGINKYKSQLLNKDKRYNIHDFEVPKIEPKIQLVQDGKIFEWDSMSPGERSSFLLNIVLDEESSKILLIDQPEDDLDNEAVYYTIVRKLRDLKKKRQIILVSHNANIVINGDSDSITVNYNNDNQFNFISKFSESNDKFDYPPRNKKYRIMDLSAEILDGGREALRKRIRKIGNNNIFYKED